MAIDSDEPDDEVSEDEEAPLDEDDAELQGEALVSCPYCGEESEITLDPGGGKQQRYVEDCPVCCRPWSVHVNFGDDGRAEAWLEELA